MKRSNLAQSKLQRSVLQLRRPAGARAAFARRLPIMVLRGCTAVLAVAVLCTLTWAAFALDALHQQHKLAPPLLRYNVQPLGRVPSAYGVSDGYWRLHVNHSSPEPSLISRARMRQGVITGNRSCWEVAKAHAEPFTDFYAPRNAPPQVCAAQRMLGWVLSIHCMHTGFAFIPALRNPATS